MENPTHTEALTDKVNVLIERYKNAKIESQSLYQQNQLLRKSYAEQTLKMEKIEARINHLLDTLSHYQS